jgi:hypothetical protein
MLASRVAALTLATGALVVATSPAFAAIEVNPKPDAPARSGASSDRDPLLIAAANIATAGAAWVFASPPPR